MLEEARELMIKFIEIYGFNDEVTIASSVLVDKILNKEGEKMSSVADVVYNHIVCSKGDEVVSVEIDFNKNLIHILTQYMYKSANKTFKSLIEKEEAEKKAKFNSVILMPHFLKESKKWENKIGIPLKYWSEAEHIKFKAYFMRKYGDMIK